MIPIVAMAILLATYALGEMCAQKTKAVLSTTLVMAVTLLAAFWCGLPATIFQDAGVSQIGNLIAVMLIVSLGTTIDFPELKRQWKVVVTGFVCVAAAVALIILLGGPLMGHDLAVAGSPIFAGGSAATLIMTAALKEKGLEALGTFCIVLYVTQKFIGIPIASLLLRREARLFLKDPANLILYAGQPEAADVSHRRKPLELPPSFARPSVYLAKLALAASAAYFASQLTGGRIHYFVMALLMGILFCSLGFLEKDILKKSQASSLITFISTIVIFSNLANTSPADVAAVIVPLLLTALLGTLGVFAAGSMCSKALHLGFGLAVSMGISCTFGFPTTMLMPQEVAEAMGTTPEERAALTNYLLPKMLTAGFVTVTISSVLLAGFVVNLL
ncbi:MAG: hypothetical protein ACOX67_04870 [Oscillospiraceae bacterium]